MLVSRLQPRAWAVSLPGSAPRAAASVYVSRAWSFRRAVRRRPATSRAADKCLRRVLRPWGQMGARWGLAGPCWGRTARAQPAALVHPLPLPCISVVFAYSPSHITLSHTFNLRSVYIPFCPVHPQDAVPQVCPCCASIRSCAPSGCCSSSLSMLCLHSAARATVQPLHCTSLQGSPHFLYLRVGHEFAS